MNSTVALAEKIDALIRQHDPDAPGGVFILVHRGEGIARKTGGRQTIASAIDCAALAIFAARGLAIAVGDSKDLDRGVSAAVLQNAVAQHIALGDAGAVRTESRVVNRPASTDPDTD